MGIFGSSNWTVIGRDFFQRDPVSCARELIGCRLQWGKISGLVVETEAYDAVGDEACHTFFRPSSREFLRRHDAGFAYIYLNYGVHWLLNVVVKGKREGFVLIRALEPLEGISTMKRRRGTNIESALCSGPGKLTRAFGITGTQHGMDLCGEEDFSFHKATGSFVSVNSPRIGISKAREMMWRFYAAENPHVSGKKKTG